LGGTITWGTIVLATKFGVWTTVTKHCTALILVAAECSIPQFEFVLANEWAEPVEL
jgi:hypothetical protein